MAYLAIGEYGSIIAGQDTFRFDLFILFYVRKEKKEEHIGCWPIYYRLLFNDRLGHRLEYVFLERVGGEYLLEAELVLLFLVVDEAVGEVARHTQRDRVACIPLVHLEDLRT